MGNDKRRHICSGILTFIVSLICLPQGAWAGWQAEWEKTLAAAKREGQVTVYIKVGYNGVFPLFQKRFPEIKVVGVTGQSFQVTQRILAERRAHKHLADVFIQGVPFPYPQLYRAKHLAPIRPLLLLPEVLDESAWYRGHRYADPEGKYVFIFLSVTQRGGAHYNVNLVNPSEFKSLWDFVKPKWKGKIEARDIRVAGPGSGAMRFFYHNPKLGPKFIRRLFGETNVTLFRDFRQGPDWLAKGKFAICFFCSRIRKAKEQGLPVDSFRVDWKEGVGLVSHSGSMALMKNAPHPNAAKVFVNWILSREGQMELQRVLRDVQDAESRRIDIPKDGVLPEVRRMEGVEYLDLDGQSEWIQMGPILKVFKKALEHSG